jgi:hypothetical protein
MTSPAPRSGAPASAGGLDLRTLWITAAASAAAAYTCSQLWAPGTLAAAAFTPVLVALLKEALTKSTDAVTRVVPVKGVVRSARPEGPPQAPAPADATLVQMPEEAAAPEARVAQLGEVTYHGSGSRRGWRLAVVTGLLGFLVCAVVFTVPELLAGNAASGGGRETTLFGGKERDREPAVTTTTTTPTQTVTLPPATTVTVPAPTVTTTTTPTVTQPPPQTTTTPTPTTTNPEDPVVPDPSEPQPPG